MLVNKKMRRRRRIKPYEIDHELAELWLQAEHRYFVDLRHRDNFTFNAITDAVHVCQKSMAEFSASTPNTADIILYCYNGSVSRYAVAEFQRRGFKHVYSLIGGFEAWRRRFPEYTRRSIN